MPKRKSFLIRIDPRLFEALQAWAGDELRSVNGQVEYLLLESVRKAGRWKSAKKVEAPERDED